MELIQTCEVKAKESAYFTCFRRDERTITKSLYNSNGRHGDIGASSSRNYVTKCSFKAEHEICSPSQTTFDVGTSKKAVVKDIDVITFTKNHYGIVVAINESNRSEAEQDDDGMLTKKEKATRERQHNSVLLYVPGRNDQFMLKRSISVFGQITCMRVLISPVDMPTQKSFVSAKIGTWPNLVAIGCEKSSCFLGQFAEYDPENAEHRADDKVVNVAATTDALKALVDKDRFLYRLAGNTRVFKKDEEQVTAVGYIPCYAVVLVGLSNGCIVMVPLDGKSCISCLSVQYSTPINFLTVLEPEYDPQGGFYVFSARERPSGNHANTALVIFSHKIARVANADGGYDYQDMNSVMIPMRDGDYWITVHGIVKKRKQRRDAEASMDTTADNSRLPEGLNTTQHMYSDGMERTLLFFTYATVDGEIKGGLFDLNAFYSRRCGVQQVRFDQYGQDPICSSFKLEVPRKNTGESLFRTKDVSWITCQSVDLYDTAIFDRDPLFQPMAARLDVQIHTFASYAYPGVVESLQWAVLDRIGRFLPESLAHPDLAVAQLERVGLELAPTTRKQRLRMEERPANERVPSELDKILRAIVADRQTRKDLIGLIERSDDRKQQLHIGRWMFNELREIIMRMDEAIAPLFDGVPLDHLSKGAKEIIFYCPKFFEFAELLFWKVRGRGIELFNDTTRLRYTRKLHALMAFALRLFLATVQWMTRVLPMCDGWTADLLEDVAELNQQRRDKARSENHPLFLDALLGRLHEKTMEDELWRGLPDPTQWYPPARFNLCSLLRQTEAELADRTALLIYYLMDVDECVARDKKKPAEERKRYPIKDSLVHGFVTWAAKDLMDGQGRAGVRERWENDMKGRPVDEKENGEGAQRRKGGAAKLSDEEFAELTVLMDNFKKYRRLQKVDEQRIRELFNKMEWGDIKWNLMLIKKGRFPEVEDLPLPPEPHTHPVVKQYAQYKWLALHQKSQLPPPTGRQPYACPITFTKSAAQAGPSTSTPISPAKIVKTSHVTIRGKTPKKLNIFKRLTAPAAPEPGSSASLLATPPGASAAATADMARINALMKTPMMNFHNKTGAAAEEDEFDERDAARGGQNDSDVAPDEVARVREALRTPRSRAHRGVLSDAALTARGGGGDGTPEAQRPAMIAPTSILKSAHKDSRLPQSATKSKLRFANVFEEKTISPRDRDNSASTGASMSQPNFDDSFDDDDDHASKSTASHDTTSGLSTTTRLEREIEEEEHRLTEARNGGEETDEASLDASHQPLSMVDEEDEDKMEEEMDEEEEAEEAPPAAGDTFQVYHDSDSARTSSTTADDDNVDVGFIEDDDVAAGGGDLPASSSPAKTPPPTPDDEQEEEEENVSRGATPVEIEGEEEQDEHHQQQQQQPARLYPSLLEDASSVAAREGELLHEEEPVETSSLSDAAASAPSSTMTAAASIILAHGGGGDDDDVITTTSSAAVNETFTVANATFTVDVTEARGGGGGAEGMEEGKEDEEEETVDDPPAAAATTAETVTAHATKILSPRAATLVEEEEEKEEKDGGDDEETVAAAGAAGAEAVQTPPPPARAMTPLSPVEEEKEEEEEEAAAPTHGDDDDEEEEGQENVSTAATPVEMEEEEEEMEEAAAGHSEEPEKEDEEEESAAVATAPRRPPPVPKPRTVFAGRAEPISLGLRSYIYMEEGVEKSYEEQRESSDEEEGEEGKKKKKEDDGDVLARVGRRRSSSRLQSARRQTGGGGEDTVGGGVGSAARKRSRKESGEKDMPGPSTSSKRDKREKEEEDDEEEGEGEEREQGGGGRTLTTTRTRIVEERYVERDDGVMQHTVKQSTKVIETADGIVVATDQDHAEMVEEEGDRREEMLDDADRVTPAMVEAAAEPKTTERTSSRKAATSRTAAAASTTTTAVGSRSRTVSTASRASVRSKKEDETKEEEKKRGEKATTPLRSPAKSVRRRKLMDDDEEEEEKKEHEVATPRRSTRTRHPSESASSTVSQTPSKSARKSSAKAAVPSTPSVARRLILQAEGDEDQEKEEEVAVAAAASAAVTPSKRGRPRKEPLDDTTAVDDAKLQAMAKRRTLGTSGLMARKRAASESVHNKKKEAESVEQKDDDEMEPEVDHVAALRALRDKTRAELIEKRKSHAARKSTRPALPVAKKVLSTVPEDSTAANEDDEVEARDRPSTSQASAIAPRSAARRKRAQSETVVKVEKEDQIMKTPSKKKTKEMDKDDDEGMGDQSMLRRSTRKAAVTANEGLKTPSKSTRGKQ